MATNPYNFIMALHASENGTGVTDYAGNTWTMNNVTNDAPISGSPTKRSLNFPGAGYLYKTAGNTLSITASQDFTVAVWVYFSSVPWHSYNAILISNNYDAEGRSCINFNRGSNMIVFGNSAANHVIFSPITNYAGTGFFLTYTRKSGIGRIFINGILKTTSSDTASYTFGSDTIGKFSPNTSDDEYSGQGYCGLLDDFSIILDKALWTTDFTLPNDYLYNYILDTYDAYNDKDDYMYGYK